jgi:hypothetical protein
LGTAIGELPPAVAAIQMHAAYRQFYNPQPVDVLGIAHSRHYMMLNPETYNMILMAHG